MAANENNESIIKNTGYKVVLPFYIYAAIAFLFATILLVNASSSFKQHYFQPGLLAITHCMALGWGTMIILGASYQLVPVLTGRKLYSNLLAYFSFFFAAIGIPLLVYAFYYFNMGAPAKSGAILINAAIVFYMVNLALSIAKAKTGNVHAVFIFTAVIWLLLTTIIGLLLIYNFTTTIFPQSSLHYLPLHAHLGIIGWFLLLVIGVGSRLIPMFLISEYSNTKLLWLIYALTNAGLLLFVVLFIFYPGTFFYLIPLAAVITAIGLFVYYCLKCFNRRIRKRVEGPVKLSLFSIAIIFLPLLLLFFIIAWLIVDKINPRWVVLYGFVVFFGWITAMILGMTFKTLPFIIWNKVYHLEAGMNKTPNPKDLFNNNVFNWMSLFYIIGFILFIIAVSSSNYFLLKLASILLLLTASLYNWNVMKLLFHKSSKLKI